MRVLVIAFAAWLLVPAAASAQSIIAQDLSITGAVVASPAPLVRKVRFTVKNNGPGTVTQHTYVVVERFGLMEIVSAPGCTIRTVAGSTLDARCELGQNLAEGATRTIDVTVRFTDIDFTRDQVRGTVNASNTVGGQGLGDRTASTTRRSSISGSWRTAGDEARGVPAGAAAARCADPQRVRRHEHRRRDAHRRACDR